MEGGEGAGFSNATDDILEGSVRGQGSAVVVVVVGSSHTNKQVLAHAMHMPGVLKRIVTKNYNLQYLYLQYSMYCVQYCIK